MRAAVALGSNLGDRLGYLRSAVSGLGQLGQVAAVSSLYETDAVGGPEQGRYLNAVVVLETSLEPVVLLAALLDLEKANGRLRGERWGPRTLDLDLIVYDDLVIETDELRLPHPRAHQRRFVTEPLNEVWPDARLANGASRSAPPPPGGVTRLSGSWTGGEVHFVDQGGRWVVIQGILLTGWAVVTVVTGRLPPEGWRWFGLVLATTAVAFGGWAAQTMGRAFTAFPAPNPHGRLVTSGPFSVVRHPIYASLAMFLPGVSILVGSLTGLAAAVGVICYFYFKSTWEERRLRVAYAGYAEYANQVRHRLIPGIL
ncbi:MAG: 2-amino-4-hydroxy-6-hydroxymethyldihydropteridine diphosphokinase [Actinomycetota bacterium]